MAVDASSHLDSPADLFEHLLYIGLKEAIGFAKRQRALEKQFKALRYAEGKVRVRLLRLVASRPHLALVVLLSLTPFPLSIQHASPTLQTIVLHRTFLESELQSVSELRSGVSQKKSELDVLNQRLQYQKAGKPWPPIPGSGPPTPGLGGGPVGFPGTPTMPRPPPPSTGTPSATPGMPVPTNPAPRMSRPPGLAATPTPTASASRPPPPTPAAILAGNTRPLPAPAAPPPRPLPLPQPRPSTVAPPNPNQPIPISLPASTLPRLVELGMIPRPGSAAPVCTSSL